MELSTAVRRRRMVRSFDRVPVAPAVVDGLLDLARRVPSAGNSQGVAFVVLEGSDTARLWDVTLPAERRATFRWRGPLPPRRAGARRWPPSSTGAVGDARPRAPPGPLRRRPVRRPAGPGPRTWLTSGRLTGTRRPGATSLPAMPLDRRVLALLFVLLMGAVAVTGLVIVPRVLGDDGAGPEGDAEAFLAAWSDGDLDEMATRVVDPPATFADDYTAAM